MRTILALSVLAAATAWSGCTSTDNRYSYDDRDHSDMRASANADELQRQRTEWTNVEFQKAYTGDKNRYHPDWAADINRPHSHPLALPIDNPERYSLEGAFNNGNRDIDRTNNMNPSMNPNGNHIDSNGNVQPGDRVRNPDNP